MAEQGGNRKEDSQASMGSPGGQQKGHMARASPRFRSIAASELVTSTLKFCCVSLNFIVF